MTEDEAKTKWCPAARITPATESHHAFDNRGDAIDHMRVAGLCIGSECMAWRWHRGGSSAVYPDGRMAGFDEYGFAAFNAQPIGHCGLVGQPA